MELNNPTFIDGMINFRKFSMIAGVFDTLFRFQQEEYGLLRLCAITNWMLEMPLLSEEELEQLADVRSYIHVLHSLTISHSLTLCLQVPKAATTTSGSSTSPKKKKRALNTMFARGPVDGSESPSQFKDQLLQQLQQQQQQQSQPLHGTSGESSLLVRKKKSKKRKSSKADAAQIAVELEELRKQRRRPGSSSVWPFRCYCQCATPFAHSLSLSLCVEPRAMGRRRTRGMVEQARTRAVVHGVGGARDPTRGDAAARAAGLDRVLPRADRCRTQAAGGHRARPPLVPRGTRNLGRHGARDTIDLGPAHRVGAVDRGERLILPSLICRYRYLCCIADCAFALSICPTYLSLSLSFSHMKSSRLL